MTINRFRISIYFIGALLIVFGIISCSENPYTGSMMQPSDLGKYLSYPGGGKVCLLNGSDSVCATLYPKRGDQFLPVIHIHPSSTTYIFYYRGQVIMQAETASDNTDLIDDMIDDKQPESDRPSRDGGGQQPPDPIGGGDGGQTPPNNNVDTNGNGTDNGSEPIIGDPNDGGTNNGGNNGGANNPNIGGTNDPNDGGTNDSKDDGTNNPNDGGTNNGGTNNPKDDGTNNPNDGGTNDSKDDGTNNPNNGGTNNPEDDGTNNPNNGGTNNGGTNNPNNGGNNDPNNGGTNNPNNGGNNGDPKDGGNNGDSNNGGPNDGTNNNRNNDGTNNDGSNDNTINGVNNNNGKDGGATIRNNPNPSGHNPPDNVLSHLVYGHADDDPAHPTHVDGWIVWIYYPHNYVEQGHPRGLGMGPILSQTGPRSVDDPITPDYREDYGFTFRVTGGEVRNFSQTSGECTDDNNNNRDDQDDTPCSASGSDYSTQMFVKSDADKITISIRWTHGMYTGQTQTFNIMKEVSMADYDDPNYDPGHLNQHRWDNP